MKMNKTNDTRNSRPAFKARNVKVDGKPARMINEDRTATVRATGEVIHAAKIQFKVLRGYVGDHEVRPIYGYGLPQWVRIERVTQ